MTSDPLSILLQHSRWLTGVLLDHCAKLSNEQFHQKFEIGCGTLHDTLHHMIGCMAAWTARVKGETYTRPTGPFTIEQLRERLSSSAKGLDELVGELQLAGAMDHVRTQRFPSSEGGTVDVTFTAGAAITHCLVHASYHAAQAVNMLRRLGVSPLPELDVIDWHHTADGKR
jgi:uncharacterized damage-inducible protein DinB